MTVSTELSHEEYTGNGVTTDFDFRFRIFEAKHLVVSIADTNGTERILTNGTDYTLRGVGSYRGGKVILKMPLATGWKIGIARDLPAVQETDLRNQGKFFAEVHEDAFDYLTMLVQKIFGFFSLCLRKPSFISDHYDAKSDKISNLGKPVKDSDAVDLGTMKEHVSAKDKRSLRVADKHIPALPGADMRRNKQLGFDNNGLPLLLDPAETGALGYVLMDSFEKGAVITSRYQALHWQSKGEYYRWDGDLRKSVPAGSTPESTGGVGKGAWISIGDASLRQNLNPFNLDIEKIRTHQNNILYNLLNHRNKLRFVTFNIYTGDTINNRFSGDFSSKERVNELQKYIISMEPSVIGMQEFVSLSENKVNCYEIKPLDNSFFGKAHNLKNNKLYGNSILSCFEIIEPTAVIYKSTPSDIDNEYRGYIKAKVLVNGKVINLINTHLSIDNTRAREMIEELAIEISKDNTNNMYIIMGDWNVEDDEYFIPLTNLGFTRANNKRFNTANNNEGWEVFIDDILYRGSAKVIDTGVIDIPIEVSDHKPFYFDIEVL